MLSQTSKQEILKRITAEAGYAVKEEDLSDGTRQAIDKVATIERQLMVIDEILEGERERVEESPVLRISSKLRRDRSLELHSEEIKKLQAEIDAKVSDIAKQVAAEVKAMKQGAPTPEYKGDIEAVELKCPSCGAALPMPTGRIVKCQYCDAAISIQDVGAQIKSAIQKI